MDQLSKRRRSWNMARIKGRNTIPELTVRSLLHKLGYRFRLHSTGLPGKPDLVLPRFRTTVFVHGCFWHRHRGCRFAYTPKSRVEFWTKKFKTNVARDKLVARELRKKGWHVLVVWECELREIESLSIRLDREISGRSSAIE